MIRCKKALLKTKVHFKQLASIELNDSEVPEKSVDVKERLQNMEHLKSKLKLTLTMCASGVIMTTTIYFLIWYHSECWALPFQESPCLQPRVWPLMEKNNSTLTEEVILAIIPHVINYYNSSLMNTQAERHRFFNIVKTAIEEFMHQQSMDLVEFSALIRDDHRFKFLKKLGIFDPYFLLFNFATIIWLFILIFVIVYDNISKIKKKEMTSTEENETSQVYLYNNKVL
ncbi:hypothetical protein Ddc_10184 [Ditylenchus destructor]|nr:hypothetical protein Ddc_10184 [Ditylenchus destructor]